MSSTSSASGISPRTLSLRAISAARARGSLDRKFVVLANVHLSEAVERVHHERVAKWRLCLFQNGQASLEILFRRAVISDVLNTPKRDYSGGAARRKCEEPNLFSETCSDCLYASSALTYSRFAW